MTGDKTIYPGRTYYYLIQIWHNVNYINSGTGLGEYVKDARIQGEAQVAVWLDCKDPTRGGNSANRYVIEWSSRLRYAWCMRHARCPVPHDAASTHDMSEACSDFLWAALQMPRLALQVRKRGRDL